MLFIFDILEFFDNSIFFIPLVKHLRVFETINYISLTPDSIN